MKSVPSVFNWLVAVNTVKQYTIMFVAGAVLMLALPPNFVVPAWLSFSLLFVVLNEARNKKHAFWLGWWFGFGYFVFGFYWVSHSLLVDPLRFAWLIPFALTLIPAISAIFTGLCAVLFKLLPVQGIVAVVFFALLWTGAEMLRGIVTQFPWNYIGYSFAMSDVTIQLAYWVKVSGMSFFAVLLGTLPALCLAKKEEGFVGVCPKIALLSWALIVALIVGYGTVRLGNVGQEGAKGIAINVENKVQKKSELQVRIVQANIEQMAETNDEQRFEIVSKHIDMTKMAGEEFQQPDLIIWPESAVPFILEREPELRALIAEVIPKGALLVTGGIRMQGKPGDEDFRYWNSFYVIDDSGNIVGVYDKTILVPFGEFVPMSNMLPFIKKVTEGLADFNAGDGVKILDMKEKGFSLIPLICYEAAFSSYISEIEKENANAVIVNVTNDAWFGNSIGPFQHYYKAKFRAVETATPLMRAANTGISGSFDEFGREGEIIRLNQSGILDIKVRLKN